MARRPRHLRRQRPKAVWRGVWIPRSV